MLFNCSNCLSCKRNVDEVKITLHQLSPSNICNKICEYNVHYEHCHSLVEDERRFSKHRQEENVSKIELQLRFFTYITNHHLNTKTCKKSRYKDEGYN